nr:MAG TPA: hypothetical protein [Caudoviricetes sp.]
MKGLYERSSYLARKIIQEDIDLPRETHLIRKDSMPRLGICDGSFLARQYPDRLYDTG